MACVHCARLMAELERAERRHAEARDYLARVNDADALHDARNDEMGAMFGHEFARLELEKHRGECDSPG